MQILIIETMVNKIVVNVKGNGHFLAGDNHCTSAPMIAKKD
jgi:hypothetical protein